MKLCCNSLRRLKLALMTFMLFCQRAEDMLPNQSHVVVWSAWARTSLQHPYQELKPFSKTVLSYFNNSSTLRKHLSFELKSCSTAGRLYLPVLAQVCAVCWRYSASTGRTMKNRIITVIILAGKYSCGSAGLNLECCSIIRACRHVQRNRNGFHCQAAAIWRFISL